MVSSLSMLTCYMNVKVRKIVAIFPYGKDKKNFPHGTRFRWITFEAKHGWGLLLQSLVLLQRLEEKSSQSVVLSREGKYIGFEFRGFTFFLPVL